MTFNPTTNRIPWGLLEQHERIALAKWPHGWERYSKHIERWMDESDLSWVPGVVYRGKPAPANKED